MLACLSRRRSRVQIPSRALDDMPGRTAKQSWPSGSREHGAVRKSAKRPSSNLGDCGFDSRLRHLKIMRRLGIGEPNCL